MHLKPTCPHSYFLVMSDFRKRMRKGLPFIGTHKQNCTLNHLSDPKFCMTYYYNIFSSAVLHSQADLIAMLHLYIYIYIYTYIYIYLVHSGLFSCFYNQPNSSIMVNHPCGDHAQSCLSLLVLLLCSTISAWNTARSYKQLPLFN